MAPWVRTYYSIRYRCNSSNAANYHKYGGCGIKALITKDELEELWEVCDADRLNNPSIDRINSKGNYTFKNCQYIELSENSRKGGKKRKRK